MRLDWISLRISSWLGTRRIEPAMFGMLYCQANPEPVGAEIDAGPPILMDLGLGEVARVGEPAPGRGDVTKRGAVVPASIRDLRVGAAMTCVAGTATEGTTTDFAVGMVGCVFDRERTGACA